LLLLVVLLLQVVDGQYAFVLHTANPLTGRHGDMFGELVAGLGEVLVSCLAAELLTVGELLTCCTTVAME
jgi:phosphoenolpyruvate synthase/pyruvate phosphate dikinase